MLDGCHRAQIQCQQLDFVKLGYPYGIGLESALYLEEQLEKFEGLLRDSLLHSASIRN